MRAGITDDTSGRATCSPSWPACGSRDRSSPHRGAPPPGAACPRAKARGCRECPGHSRAQRPKGAKRTAAGRARRPRADLDRGLHSPKASGRRGPAFNRRPLALVARVSSSPARAAKCQSTVGEHRRLRTLNECMARPGVFPRSVGVIRRSRVVFGAHASCPASG